jgi:hypothetical protein
MLALAHQLANAARQAFTAPLAPGLWTISTGYRVVGTLICEAGQWRLGWFAGADPRLSNYAGPLDGDIDALANALSARLGAAVELESLPV